MAPKKGQKQKMSLNDFLADDALGSWADEMDSLPTAPAARGEGDDGDRRGGRDDYLSRGDRNFPPREDLPLPTAPPYTAFVGNMAFDLTEMDLETFFDGLSVKSAKVIKDRDDRPKGFGYVEFAELDDLKGALAKSGTSLAGRTIRISVAEPPKERSGFGGGHGGFDDAKFDGEWRRTGPLPDLPGRGGSGGGRRFDGPDRDRDRDRDRMPPPASAADTVSEWRSAIPSRAPAPSDDSARRRPGFFAGESKPGTADREETWSKGSRFRPSDDGPPSAGSERRSGFGGGFRRDEPPSSAASEGTWRTSRPALSRESTSPSSSTPPTPQPGGRRKLELLPRSGGGSASASPSPLASPKLSQPSAPKANPFGNAKPVDVSAREAAVAERLEREREAAAAKTPTMGHAMSRDTSRTGSQRGSQRGGPRAPPAQTPNVQSTNVRSTFSFAAAAKADENGVDSVAEQVGEVSI